MANDKKVQKQALAFSRLLQQKYGEDFVGWTRDTIDFTSLKYPSLTDQQILIANSLIEHKNLCVSAGGGLGKSAVAALLTIWFLTCHPHAKVVTTAPSGKQLTDILWGEINLWLKRYRYNDMLIPLTGRLVVKGFREWFAVARTVPKDNKDLNDTLAGFHAPHLLIIVDEASGVPDPVFTALDGAMTDKNAMILLISNPVSTSGYYYDTINDPEGKGKNWKVLYLDARESPLVDSTYEERIASRYGRDSAMYRAKVMGQPIQQTDAFVVTPEEFDKVVRENREVQYGRIVMAVDVAGSGEDMSIICHRSGNSIIKWDEYPLNDTTFLANEVERLAAQYSGREVVAVVDALGLGAGVYDILRANRKVNVIAFIGSERATHETMYDRRRDEGYHLLHKQFKELHFPVPPPERLKKELVNIEFDYASGKVQLRLSKKDLKRRIGFSPDYADALMMTCIVDNFAVKCRSVHVSKGLTVTMQSMLSRTLVANRYGKYGKFF